MNKEKGRFEIWVNGEQCENAVLVYIEEGLNYLDEGYAEPYDIDILFHEIIEYGVLQNKHNELLALCDSLSEEAGPCTCSEPVLVIDPQTLAELDSVVATLKEDKFVGSLSPEELHIFIGEVSKLFEQLEPNTVAEVEETLCDAGLNPEEVGIHLQHAADCALEELNRQASNLLISQGE